MFQNKVITERRQVTIRVFGGLGNQLFQYYYGQYLKKEFGYKIIYDVSWAKAQRVVHSGNISFFSLEDQVDGLEDERSKRSRILHQFFLSNRPVFYLAKYMLGFLNKIQISSSIGYSSRDYQLNKRTNEVVGYFQTWKYFVDSGGKKLHINSASASSWYYSTLRYIEGLDSVGVHIRRGDYKQNHKSIGLLELTYFEELINEIHKANPQSYFLIFTDDESCLDLNLPDYINWQQVVPPNDSHPAESLLLLSSCKTICLSNSTFSYWAALFADNSTVRYVPRKWYRNMTDPMCLLPESWVKIDSRWEKDLSE